MSNEGKPFYKPFNLIDERLNTSDHVDYGVYRGASSISHQYLQSACFHQKPSTSPIPIPAVLKEGSLLLLLEALCKVICGRLLRDMRFFHECTGVHPMVQFGLVFGAGHGQVDGAVFPGREQDGIGQFDGTDTVGCRGDQRGALQDGIGEVL